MNHLLAIGALIGGYMLGRYLTEKSRDINQADVNIEEAKRIINNKTKVNG